MFHVKHPRRRLSVGAAGPEYPRGQELHETGSREVSGLTYFSASRPRDRSPAYQAPAVRWNPPTASERLLTGVFHVKQLPDCGPRMPTCRR